VGLVGARKHRPSLRRPDFGGGTVEVALAD